MMDHSFSLHNHQSIHNSSWSCLGFLSSNVQVKAKKTQQKKSGIRKKLFTQTFHTQFTDIMYDVSRFCVHMIDSGISVMSL